MNKFIRAFYDPEKVINNYLSEENYEGAINFIQQKYQFTGVEINLNKDLVSASSLEDYIKSQPAGSRPWQKTLITSNQKVTSLGLKFKTLTEGLEEIKKHDDNVTGD